MAAYTRYLSISGPSVSSISKPSLAAYVMCALSDFGYDNGRSHEFGCGVVEMEDTSGAPHDMACKWLLHLVRGELRCTSKWEGLKRRTRHAQP